MEENTDTEITPPSSLQALAKLREPFPDNQISKLPKPTKAQTEAVKADFKKGARCKLCGTWHHPEVVHLDYVGHAALTYRLLEADPLWNWTPLSFTAEGLPRFDSTGGLWIKLTVAGVERLGYGHAESSTFKDSGSREKEVIGDALRNAAMRFGAALNLWHKGDLHIDEEHQSPAQIPAGPIAQTRQAEPQQKPAYVPKANNPPVKNMAPNPKTQANDWLKETQARVLDKR